MEFGSWLDFEIRDLDFPGRHLRVAAQAGKPVPPVFQCCARGIQSCRRGVPPREAVFPGTTQGAEAPPTVVMHRRGRADRADDARTQLFLPGFWQRGNDIDAGRDAPPTISSVAITVHLRGNDIDAGRDAPPTISSVAITVHLWPNPVCVHLWLFQPADSSEVVVKGSGCGGRVARGPGASP